MRKRWAEGETYAKALFREIKAIGCNGHYKIPAAFQANYSKTPRTHSQSPVEKEATFSSRSPSIALCLKDDEREEDDKPLLNKLLKKSDLLGQARDLSLEFKTMMEQKKGTYLGNWYQLILERSSSDEATQADPWRSNP